MTMAILLILVIPVGGFLGALSNQAYQFYEKTKDSVSLQKIEQFLQSDSLWAARIKKAAALANVDTDSESIRNFSASLGSNIGLSLSRQLSSMASNLIDFLINFFVMMVMIYYLFLNGKVLREFITGLLPLPVEQQNIIVKKFEEMGKAIINGNLFSGIIQGILGGLGFFVFGLGSSLLWGALIGFFAFLPFIGAPAIFIPAALILFLQGKAGIAIGFLVYNLVYSQAIEYYFKPKYIGKGMSMNPGLVFIGVLGGIKLFGVLGIIYGPLILTVFFTLLEIYKLEYIESTD
jgi:predicted PurR-regulated permease PerM